MPFRKSPKKNTKAIIIIIANMANRDLVFDLILNDKITQY